MGPKINKETKKTQINNKDDVRPIRVNFELRLSENCFCPIKNIDGSIENIQQHMKEKNCHTDIEVETEEGNYTIIHKNHLIQNSCPCNIFHEFDCIPHIKNIQGDTFTAEIYVNNIEKCHRLINNLKKVGREFRLISLEKISSDKSETNDYEKLNLNILTEKQKEAVILAVKKGYYDSSKEISLEELAEKLDISKSAMSQRLKTAESKLVTSVFVDK